MITEYSQESGIDLDDVWDPLEEPLVLSPTILGDLRIDHGPVYYFVRRPDLRDLLRLGRYVSIQWEDKSIPNSGCMRHPNGSAIIISLQNSKSIINYIIARRQFEQVVRADVRELVVPPCREEV